MRVVASNDDEIMFADVIDIKRIVLTRVDEFGQGTFHCKLRRGKFLGGSQGKTAVDGLGLKCHYVENQHEN